MPPRPSPALLKALTLPLVLGGAWWLVAAYDLANEAVWTAQRAFVARAGWLVVPAAVPVYIVLVAGFVPPTVLSTVAGFLAGPYVGAFAALAGVNASAWTGFALARTLLHDGATKLVNRRFPALGARAGRMGWPTVLYMRVVAVPFQVVNLVAGASPMPFSAFATGTFLGTLPGVFVCIVLGDRLPVLFAGRAADLLTDGPFLAALAFNFVVAAIPIVARRGRRADA